MDPNETLLLLRADAKRHRIDSLSEVQQSLMLRRVIDHFEALDQWLSRGGFMPDAWHSQECVVCGRDDVAKMEARCSRHKAA